VSSPVPTTSFKLGIDDAVVVPSPIVRTTLWMYRMIACPPLMIPPDSGEHVSSLP
jgi:hypothetical protein